MNELDIIIKALRVELGVDPPGFPEQPQEQQLQRVYETARLHSVGSMVYRGLRKSGVVMEDGLERKWSVDCQVETVRSITQTHAMDEIVRELPGNGIDLLPLKGCMIKEMYPRTDDRQMGDLDFLIRAEDLERAGDLLEGMGYERQYLMSEVHNIYLKQPYCMIELHRKMFSDNAPAGYRHFDSVWQKAKPEKPHLYSLSWDDFYLYFMFHMYTHYTLAGTGIRSVMDVYVLKQKHAEDFHPSYISREAGKLGMRDFMDQAEQLAEVWFGSGSYTAETEKMRDFILASGVYGSEEHFVALGMEKKGRLRYLRDRMFPGKEAMKNLYPFIRRRPYLYPVGYGMRIVTHLKKGFRELLLMFRGRRKNG